MARRRSACGFLALGASMLMALGGCHQEASRGTVDTPTAGESENEGRAAPSAGSGAAGSTRVEPMHLPFDDFAPTDAADPYTYHRTLSPGCTLAYQRWWATPPDPGAPVEQVAVRSARLAGVAAYALVYDVGDGGERVWRRGEGYQVALAFEGCPAPAVDAVLAESEALTTPRLGTRMPEAEPVCMGPRASLVLHTATPSRAGVYTEDMPIQGEHLNWTVPGVGCVTYPGLSNRMPCGGGSHPWVARTLCQQ